MRKVGAMVEKTPEFNFNDESDLPLWVQLRDRMVYLMNSGYYKPGEKLPTVRKFAADLRISYNTVNKAYMGLERDGYVTTVRGSGTFVNDFASTNDNDDPLDSVVEDFIDTCLEKGLTYDDIPKLVARHIRN